MPPLEEYVPPEVLAMIADRLRPEDAAKFRLVNKYTQNVVDTNPRDFLVRNSRDLPGALAAFRGGPKRLTLCLNAVAGAEQSELLQSHDIREVNILPVARVHTSCIERLAENRNLTSLSMSMSPTQWTSDGPGDPVETCMTALGQSTSITKLTLRNADISEAGYSALARSTSITELKLPDNWMHALDANGANAARSLAGNTSIRHLSLAGSTVNGQILESLFESRSITHLDLSGCKGIDTAMRRRLEQHGYLGLMLP